MTERDEQPVPDDAEVPEADALEQRADAVPSAEDEDPAGTDGSEADEADRAEQSRVVDVDEDEYR